jgi:asparagine synthase (glutamine-hydrolysing)
VCGIAGILRNTASATGTDRLERMQAAVAHRGPDDRGVWQSPGGHAAYAHTRLSIIDLSPAGHQPMTIADGRFTITYNGEIYNFAELRRSLAATGVVFRSNSDTEVILRLYELEGPVCVERLRGMFAFAIWDERDRTCFLARDRFGIKPLYYHEAGDVLTFASEVRALIASGVSTTLDTQATYEYFRSGSVPEPLTLFRGMRALEAGQYMIWRAGQIATRQYWDINFDFEDAEAEPVQATRAALLDSVAHHFVSDVPVGVFLSGGVDSTAIVALARAVRPEKLRTFSITFPGSLLDEGPQARHTAEHFATQHHEWAVDATTARPLFDEFLSAADQPSIDGFNTYTVSRLAARQGVKVVLSGLGGDEIFGGYPSFREVPRLARMGRWVARAGPAASGALRAAGAIAGSRVRRLSDLVARPPSLEDAYQVFRGVYTRDEALALTDHYVGGSRTVVDYIDPLSTVSADDPRDVVSRLEITRYMRNQLLRDTDVMSMACGIELRVPFLDSKLFATMSRIPACQRMQRGKRLLTLAVPEIPEWVAARPKRGFMFPMQQWFEHDWAGDFGNISQSKAQRIARMDTWYRKWSVLAFEHWLQRTAPQHV